MSVTGIVLYNIELDGCLNGVYTNNHAVGDIYNEIARNKSGKHTPDFTGIYDTVYFDDQNSPNQTELTVSLSNKVYEFSWNHKVHGRIFRGAGYKMNDWQIVVHYSDQLNP